MQMLDQSWISPRDLGSISSASYQRVACRAALAAAITLQKLLADVCPTQFGRDKIDCSHAKCRRCCFYFCDNFHFPTNKKEEKTIAAVIYYKKLNILSALINIYLNFKISTSSSQTIPFQFLYFLSRPNCVGQTSAKSFWSVPQYNNTMKWIIFCMDCQLAVSEK